MEVLRRGEGEREGEEEKRLTEAVVREGKIFFFSQRERERDDVWPEHDTHRYGALEEAQYPLLAARLRCATGAQPGGARASDRSHGFLHQYHRWCCVFLSFCLTAPRCSSLLWCLAQALLSSVAPHVLFRRDSWLELAYSA